MRTVQYYKIPPPHANSQLLEASSASERPPVVNDNGIIEGEYIVTFNNQFDSLINESVARQVDQLREQILKASGIPDQAVLSRYRYAIKGFAAKLDSNQVQALQNDPRIANISPNVMLQLGIENASVKKSYTTATKAANQIVPWGVARVRGPFNGTGHKAWVLDTGIDLDHPDLNVDTQNSTSFIPGENANDLDGHGTHVAGSIAAKDNTIDVVGVAAGATVVSVKVCGQSGCPINIITDGVDYVSNRATAGDVANISIWGRVTSSNESAFDVLESAIAQAAISKGIRFTLIAGNAADGANDYGPGRMNANNVYTISAYDQYDDFATTLSNYNNPPIDFGGPGVSVLSLYKDGGTATFNGTSMAAPHVAGILLATGSNPVPTDGTVNNDLDSRPDKIAALPSDLAASISGPAFVSNGQQGNWTAQTSGGETPFGYQWFRNDYGSSTPYWLRVSTSSSYSTTVTDSFQLRLHVTDDTNTTVITDVFDVATN